MIKKFLLFLLIVLVAIQFFRPERNVNPGPHPYSIDSVYKIPENIRLILDKACMDCHSNNTRYPWYQHIQPVAWWLAQHVEEGKSHFNMDEYTNKRPRYQYHKMEEVIEMVKTHEMPLDSYTWMHKEAKLTDTERKELEDWAFSVMQALKQKYPADSLLRRPQ